MNALILSAIFLTSSLYAGYGKPQMVARYAGIDSYNAPAGINCFSSEPQPTKEGVFLGCQTLNGFMMVKWTPKFEKITETSEGLFSHPKQVDNKISWYEFNDAGAKKLYEYQNGIFKTSDLKKIGSITAQVDGFTPAKNGFYVYRLQEESVKTLSLWKNNSTSVLTMDDPTYIFPPTSSSEGSVLAKIRRDALGDSAPDELVIWDNGFKTILKDRDADPASPIISFRHQYALDQNSAAVVVKDVRGEAMVIIKDGKVTEIARAGKELASFDFFAPKMRQGILVFRGVDHQNRKAVYVYSAGRLKTLLTQGDVVMTDRGEAQVNYSNQDAILYGAPGIGPEGDIYQQATLVDLNSPMTLLGVALLKFKRE